MYLWQNNKNMEDKYYIPEIEEFHVGFECELHDNDKVFKWFPIECTQETLYDVQSSHYNARVKYLDTKDIESFGWIEDKGFLLDDSTWFKLNSNYLRHYYHGELYIQNGNKEMIFNGVCKNKSELKRVLKQIGFKQLK